MPRRLLLALLPALFLAACGSQPPRPIGRDEAAAPQKPAPAPRRGGYYQDDGPGDNAPQNLEAIADALPKAEPLHRYANRPYTVLGRDYVPMRSLAPYAVRGVASWYGRKFHGQKTSSGEPYDMYGMTAAHPTLPIPSYVRVTNLANGKSVVVRVNDRGPFHADRLIDLSYTAAWKLGYVGSGSALVQVEAVMPGDAALAAAGEIPPVRQKSPPAPPPRGTFLQLGAFGSEDNAESFRARMREQLAWLAETIHVRPGDGVFRVHLGPYRDAREAGRVAERIREALDFEPLVVQR